MAFLHSTVKDFEHFREFGEEVDLACEGAINAGSRAGADAASAIAAQRSKSGEMEKMEISEASGDVDGYTGGFSSDAWYAWFQSAGTLAARSRQLKRGGAWRSTPSGAKRYAKVSGGQGITPLHFFETGRTVGRAKMIEELARLI